MFFSESHVNSNLQKRESYNFLNYFIKFPTVVEYILKNLKYNQCYSDSLL